MGAGFRQTAVAESESAARLWRTAQPRFGASAPAAGSRADPGWRQDLGGAGRRRITLA